MFVRVSIPCYRHTDDEQTNDHGNMNSEYLNMSSDNSRGTNPGRGHVVYQLEVVSNNFGDLDYSNQSFGETGRTPPLGQGRVFHLEKRYSAFLSLHNEVRTII